MMSRQMVLVFLLVILIITSQFEWKQQLVDEIEATPSISEKPQHNSNREDAVKEKIILSQEKNIQRLNELVRSLRDQLHQCCGSNNDTINSKANQLTENVNEHEQQQILED